MQPPLICHVVYRLDYGGLENGLVNLINHLPASDWTHVIICLAGHSDFRRRLRPDVAVIDCLKREGHDLLLLGRLWRLLRRLRPDILHTRNLASLEAQLPGALAGVTVRVHGEHGHDVHDLDNQRRRYRWLRRAFRPLISRYVTVSQVLEDYLAHEVGVTRDRIRRICNGVDTGRFRPRREGARELLRAAPFAAEGRLIIGTIGRMQAVKDQPLLARAFVELLRREPDRRARLALVMIGDGPLRDQVRGILSEAGAADLAWLPGTRDDTPALLNAFDLFVLPSLAEGISNTVLEAMASALPVIATDVGGNPELVIAGRTGRLVPRANAVALADAIEGYLDEPGLLAAHGAAARQRAEEAFSLDVMVRQYERLYTELLHARSTPLPVTERRR